MKPLSLIVAYSENRVIGRDGDLPWKLSADLRRFKKLTTGHHIIMGRKTWESIDRLLPGRTTVVISRNPDYQVEGAIVVDGLDAAIESASADDEPFVIGGAEIFRQALPLASRLYLTRVLAEVEGDCFLPEIDLSAWEQVSAEHVPADGRNQYAHAFEIYQRNTG